MNGVATISTDVATVKQTQQTIWGSGDFRVISNQQMNMSELLCGARELPHHRVLDVATGTGNTALAAAHRNTQDVTGPDFSPSLVDIARQRAKAQRLETAFEDGDAKDLPYEGEHHQVYDCVVSPKPDPLPPIMVGGGGEKLTLRVAAKHADWWNFQGGTVDFYKYKVNVFKSHYDDVGRDFDEIVQTWSVSCVAVADTEEEVEEMARKSAFFSEDGAIYGTP